MTPANDFTHVSRDNLGVPLASQSETHSSLFRLRKQSALFGDLGRHLSMLGELIEQELSCLPSPPGSCGTLGRNSPAHQSWPCLNGDRVAKRATFSVGPPHATRPFVELASVLKAAEGFASRPTVTNVGAIGAAVKPTLKTVFGPGSFPPSLPPVEDGSEPAPSCLEIGKDGARGPPKLSCSNDSLNKNISEDDEAHSTYEQPGQLARHENVRPPSYSPIELPGIPRDHSDEDSVGTRLSETSVAKERSSTPTRCTIEVVNYLQNRQQSAPFEEPSTVQGYLRKMMASRTCECVLAVIVFGNAVLLGVQADHRIRGHEPNLWYRVMDVTFTVFFLAELCLRLYLDRWSFFSLQNPNFVWNITDAAIIGISTVEEILYISSATFALINPSSLRMLRTLRVVRLLRTVRLMRYFRDLRVMISGIFSSLKSLSAAVALLSMLLYLTSVLIVDTLTESPHATQSQTVMQWYGGVNVSSYTLFLSILGGIDWDDAAAPLFAVSPPLGFAFLLYVTFSLLCVLNTITGVFVENAGRLTAKTDVELLAERMLLHRNYIANAQDIISDTCPSGIVGEEEFTELLGKVEFQAVLMKLDVRMDQNMSGSLFQAMDFDGEGHIDASELSNRIGKFHGQAKSIDVLHVLTCLKKLNARIDRMVSCKRLEPVSSKCLGREFGMVSAEGFHPKQYHECPNGGRNPSGPLETTAEAHSAGNHLVPSKHRAHAVCQKPYARDEASTDSRRCRHGEHKLIE